MIYQNSKLLKIVFNRYNLRIESKINYKVLKRCQNKLIGETNANKLCQKNTNTI